MLRYVGMFLLGCTGVGAIYMLARLQWVKPNNVGVVVNYQTQQYERLEPGLHCILSPFRSYIDEVSTQVQVHRLSAFPVKSLDNVDATVQADFTYTISDPLALYQKVKDPVATFTEAVRSALSAAIQTLTFSNITAAEINHLARKAGHSEHEEEELEEKELTSISDAVVEHDQQSLPSSQRQPMKAQQGQRGAGKEEKKGGEQLPVSNALADGAKLDAHRAATGAQFFRSLIKQLSGWGIKIENFRINSNEAKHKKVSEALELTAEADVRARAQLKAASSEAHTIRILAEAEKDAQVIRAKAAVGAAKEMKEPRAALELYTQENRVRAAQALSGGKNPVLIGVDSNNRSSFAAFTAFSATNRPRSLSEGSGFPPAAGQVQRLQA